MSWQWSGSGTKVDILRKFDGAVIEINCGSTCNGCLMASRLLLEPIDSRKSPYEGNCPITIAQWVIESNYCLYLIESLDKIDSIG